MLPSDNRPLAVLDRALSKVGNGDAVVAPSGAGIHEVDIKVA